MGKASRCADLVLIGTGLNIFGGDMNLSVVHDDDYVTQAFGLGLQYLATGRFAAAACFMPVSGNLLHHAVEMLLKGSLAKLIGVSQLPRGRNGHDLNALWKLYRQHYPDPILDRYSPLVADLHRFEYIRYPENLIAEGGFLAIGFPNTARSEQLGDNKLPQYQLTVAEVDALAKEIFIRGSVNPAFYTFHLKQEHASKYFEFENESPLV